MKKIIYALFASLIAIAPVSAEIGVNIGVSGQELSMYRFLVGSKNLVGTKKFLELARSGNSIPSTFVKQYLPAIKVIDDIVKAGPGYVQMLRSLQSRAKKRR